MYTESKCARYICFVKPYNYDCVCVVVASKSAYKFSCSYFVWHIRAALLGCVSTSGILLIASH